MNADPFEPTGMPLYDAVLMHAKQVIADAQAVDQIEDPPDRLRQIELIVAALQELEKYFNFVRIRAQANGGRVARRIMREDPGALARELSAFNHHEEKSP